MALKLSDYVVTEAGFATDLGAEKFIDIKCRIAGLKPQAVVIVATAKAVAWHGGARQNGGLANLQKHIENIKHFGLKPVVAINRFSDDKPAQLRKIVAFCVPERVLRSGRVAPWPSRFGSGFLHLATRSLGYSATWPLLIPALEPGTIQWPPPRLHQRPPAREALRT